MLMMFLTACHHVNKPPVLSLKVLEGWVDGTAVYYVTTDVSDKKVASLMHANYAPRLKDAIPRYPKSPTDKTVLERVYAFPGGEQQKNVFASAPKPVGSGSGDPNYSPLWLMFEVKWLKEDKVSELTSEGDIFRAEAKGWVTISRTSVVVNCPVVGLESGPFLPVP